MMLTPAYPRSYCKCQCYAFHWLLSPEKQNWLFEPLQASWRRKSKFNIDAGIITLAKLTMYNFNVALPAGEYEFFLDSGDDEKQTASSCLLTFTSIVTFIAQSTFFGIAKTITLLILCWSSDRTFQIKVGRGCRSTSSRPVIYLQNFGSINSFNSPTTTSSIIPNPDIKLDKRTFTLLPQLLQLNFYPRFPSSQPCWQIFWLSTNSISNLSTSHDYLIWTSTTLHHLTSSLSFSLQH